ncbi:hypothetical protein BKA65DRAFT_555838 [Rhexocercosporidium sp. MPI-PUGE-AT-0058]|nr:hypothetical protein BKA65DRAFT_555838 [Rhexocercosporidium sp. MPI-PUGE-AT-0058]
MLIEELRKRPKEDNYLFLKDRSRLQNGQVHASMIKYDTVGVIRLATDLCFCGSSRAYDQRWLNFYQVA